MKLHFWIVDHGGTFEDSYEFEVKSFDPENDLEWAAEQYAEYYHSHRDGWESCWPIEFSVAKPDGTLLGVVSVDRETRPEFIGRKIKE